MSETVPVTPLSQPPGTPALKHGRSLVFILGTLTVIGPFTIDMYFRGSRIDADGKLTAHNRGC